ncbi:MAG: LysM peptidoglycan-binding domain-containing protein [Candidatus Coatesbacteria bacterium]|nr:LysM peptidoglycan-binding domain-containing protein [Candidatus Coatesbacteria bacterium]
MDFSEKGGSGKKTGEAKERMGIMNDKFTLIETDKDVGKWVSSGANDQEGVFVFTPLAPQKPISLSGPPTIATMTAPGRRPIYQFLGPGGNEISFGGVLYGENAWDEYKKLETWRRGGKRYTARWGRMQKHVVIADISFEIESRRLIRYRMRLSEVIDDPRELRAPEAESAPLRLIDKLREDLAGILEAIAELRGELSDFYEEINELVTELESYVDEFMEALRFIDELSQLPQNLITEFYEMAESFIERIGGAMGGLEDYFADPDNLAVLNRSGEENVNSRAAAETIFAYLRSLWREKTLLRFSLGALLEPPERIFRYIVSQGDTLRQIAASELGDPGRWNEIAEANDLISIEIEAGEVLRIPK